MPFKGGDRMLKIVKCMRDLPFSELMDVYIEGNEEKAKEYGDGGLLRAEQEFYSYLQEDFFKTTDAFYCIWQDNGKSVSALRLEPYRDGWLLEALETAPEFRKRGYAKALVQAVIAYMDNRVIYSHVSKSNVASLQTHSTCGFEIWKDCAMYIDGSVNQRAFTLRYIRK